MLSDLHQSITPGIEFQTNTKVNGSTEAMAIVRTATKAANNRSIEGIGLNPVTIGVKSK